MRTGSPGASVVHGSKRSYAAGRYTYREPTRGRVVFMMSSYSGANVRPIVPAVADTIGHSSGRGGHDETVAIAARATFRL